MKLQPALRPPSAPPGVLAAPLAGLTVGRIVIGMLPLLAAAAFVIAHGDMVIEVALSFLVLGLAISMHAIHAIAGRSNSAADASVFAFGLMFLLVAPIVQLLTLGYRLVNTTFARPDLIIETNLACSLFIAVYLVARMTVFKPPAAGALHVSNAASELKTAPKIKAAKKGSDPWAATVQIDLSAADAAQVAQPATTRKPTRLFAICLLVGVCVLIALFSVPFAGANVSDQSLTPVLLAFRKFLFFVPTALFLILICEFRATDSQRRFVNVLLLLLLFLCVLATQNTATEKRNGLGPVYLAMLFVMFRGYFQRRGVQVGWLIGVLLFLFPLASIFTTIPLQYLTVESFTPQVLSDHFVTTHYDAWANIYTSIEMVARNGLSGGKQLAGALMFYVPSTWWSGKPLATGIEIGTFLMTFYTMWFTNLSAPLVAEGFLDFGYFGVIAYGFALAGAVKLIEINAAPGRSPTQQAVAIYFCFFLVFLLRGSLMIAFAYGSGALAAFVACRLMLALLSSGISLPRPAATGAHPATQRSRLAATRPA